MQRLHAASGRVVARPVGRTLYRDLETSRNAGLTHGRNIAVIGLGYVGLPVAAAFARSGAPVVGFDISADRIAELRRGHDRTQEVAGEDLANPNLRLAESPADLASADFFIVTVPTPIDSARRPDLTALLRASQAV